MAARRAGPRDLPLLGERLEALRRDWSARRLDSDPLAFPHRFRAPADREVVAFLAASLAFGRVASIQASVSRVLEALGPRPAEFLEGWDERPLGALHAFRHRWVSGKDVEDLLRMVKRVRRAHGSLGALFEAGDKRESRRGFLEDERARLRLEGEASGPPRRRSPWLRSRRLRFRPLYFSKKSSRLLPPRSVPSRGLSFLLPAPQGRLRLQAAPSLPPLDDPHRGIRPRALDGR